MFHLMYYSTYSFSKGSNLSLLKSLNPETCKFLPIYKRYAMLTPLPFEKLLCFTCTVRSFSYCILKFLPLNSLLV